jgi:hypothetical protein
MKIFSFAGIAGICNIYLWRDVILINLLMLLFSSKFAMLGISPYLSLVNLTVCRKIKKCSHEESYVHDTTSN